MPMINIDPEIEKRPVLSPGDYGADGEAKLEVMEQRPARWDDAKSVMHFQVSVKHPELGYVRVFSDKDLGQGSQVPKLLRQLGVSDEQMRDGFDPQDLLGMNVIITVGVRTAQIDGEPTPINTMRNLSRVL